MQANELRIGNWIYKNIADFLGNHSYRLIGWDIWQASIHPDELNIEFKPIPLTPDILEKAGFKYSEYYQEYYLPDYDRIIELKFVNDLWYPILRHDPEFSSLNEQVIGLNHIQYVHTLQNLIFALTGKELEIKL